VKIVKRELRETADASAARGTGFRELRRLLFFAALLAIAIYLAVSVLVDLVVARISYENEARLFASLSPFHGIASTNDARLGNLQGILDALVADPEVPPLPYRLVVIPEEQPNAFAFPGGAIGVTTGLLAALEEDIEFAFVLGHELGHFHHRDHLRGVGRAVGVGVAYTILFGGQMGGDTLHGILRYVLDRGYSRRQEATADRFGVGLVHRVYGKTQGVDRLFQILEEKEEIPPWAYMFATHPSPERRIASLKAYADRLAPPAAAR
jgi:Zn-dependent protease with chaperone function